MIRGQCRWARSRSLTGSYHWLPSIADIDWSLYSFYLVILWCVFRCIWWSTDSLLNHVAMHLSSLTMRETCMVSLVQNFSHCAMFVIVQVTGKCFWCVRMCEFLWLCRRECSCVQSIHQRLICRWRWVWRLTTGVGIASRMCWSTDGSVVCWTMPRVAYCCLGFTQQQCSSPGRAVACAAADSFTGTCLLHCQCYRHHPLCHTLFAHIHFPILLLLMFGHWKVHTIKVQYLVQLQVVPHVGLYKKALDSTCNEGLSITNG